MSGPSQPQLRTARLVLRPFVREDAPAVQHLAGAREIADTTLNVPHPYSDGLAEEWIDSHAPAFAAGCRVACAVTDQSSGALLGAVSLGIHPSHARGELGYWIGVPFWGAGYATEASRALVEYGFTHLELNRIEARHLVRNPASGRVIQKLGLSYEGTLRQSVRKWGRFEDLAMYSLLAADVVRPHA